MSEETLRDRLASLSRLELVGLALVVGVTLLGAGVWYVRSLPRPVDVQAQPGGGFFPAAGAPGRSGGPVAGPAVTPSPASIFVDVAGWVRHPGVYEFHEGDRVIDAIEAAGGERGDAQLDALNLAAPLTDGAQILVPKQAPAAPAGAVPGADSSSGIGASGPAAKINVNTADATQLQELPGIGEVLSQAIIDYRTKNGPFSSVDELEDVSGIGPTTLEDIRDLVAV